MRLPENKFSKVRIILYVAGLVPVAWIAMLAAPAFSKGGVFEILRVRQADTYIFDRERGWDLF